MENVVITMNNVLGLPKLPIHNFNVHQSDVAEIGEVTFSLAKQSND